MATKIKMAKLKRKTAEKLYWFAISIAVITSIILIFGIIISLVDLIK